MERISLTNNVTLSRLIYGMWRLSDDTDTSASHVQAKIEACLAQGITTMDQADIYGGYEAEEVLGHALRAAPQLRDKIEIVTKCDILVGAGRYASTRVKHYDTSAAHIADSVDHSLRLMATDHIDLLLIHRPDPLMDHRETGAALMRRWLQVKWAVLGYQTSNLMIGTCCNQRCRPLWLPTKLRSAYWKPVLLLMEIWPFCKSEMCLQWLGHLLQAARCFQATTLGFWHC